MTDEKEKNPALTPPVVPGVPTVEEAREQFQKQMSGESLQSMLGKEDERGNSHIFGLVIPKTLRPLVEFAYATALPYIQRSAAETAYKVTNKSMTRMKASSKAAHGTAVGLENVVRWGLVGGKHVADIVHANRDYRKERKELFQEFAPVMDATKTNYQKNEVMKIAFDQLHHDMVTDMKMVAADLPTIIPTALFAMQDQANFAKRRKTIAANTAAEQGKTSELDELLKMQREQIKNKKNLEKSINESRKQFVEEHAKGEGYEIRDGEFVKDRERLKEIFDNDFERELRYSYQRRMRNAENVNEEALQNKYENKMQWVIPGATLISQMIKSTIQERAAAKHDNMNAWKLIKHLKVEMDEEFAANSDKTDHSFTTRSADEVYINAIGTRHNEHISLTDYIVEVLQEHERDRLGVVSKEGERAKNPLGPAMINKMMPAIEMVAEEIASGRLDPYALVTIVGEDKLIKHKANGARSFAETSEVRKSLDELLGTMSNREAVTPEEFFSNFADPALIENTLKENLASMHGTEKAFFASLFPDDILKQAGVDREDIVELRKRAHEHMYDIVGATVIHMADRDHEHLRSMGLSNDDIDHVSELANKIREGDMKALQVAVDGRNKSVIEAVRNVGLHEQLAEGGEGKKFWADRVRESSDLKKEMAEGRKPADDNYMSKDDFEESWNTEAGDSYSERERNRKKKPPAKDMDAHDFEESWNADVGDSYREREMRRKEAQEHEPDWMRK